MWLVIGFSNDDQVSINSQQVVVWCGVEPMFLSMRACFMCPLTLIYLSVIFIVCMIYYIVKSNYEKINMPREKGNSNNNIYRKRENKVVKKHHFKSLNILQKANIHSPTLDGFSTPHLLKT